MDDRPEVKFRKVLDAAQKNRASHQKCLHILDGIYKKTEFNVFKQIFLRYLKAIFATESWAVKNENVERLLEFLAHFVVQTIPTEDNETVPDDPFEDVSTHPFFTDIVMETLKFHCLTNASLRYNSCLYLRLLLQNISSNINVDSDVCDRIMEAMLERTTDIKSSIRLQAVMALVKLQDPSDPDCPVIKAYLGLLLDGNPMVRSEVVKRIAAYMGSAPYIMRHLRDVDANVRLQAFKRCADMGPKMFKIYERQDILMSGLNETHDKVKKAFQETLLIKWLNAYEGDFIKLLNSIKIDAEESDMLKTQHISKRLMDIYFKIRPIRDIISSLPLNEEKLIPQEKVVAEVILLWDFLVEHVRKCGGELNMDLEEILPELTPFCEYIQRTVDNAKGKNMEDWEYLEYQHILYSLFQIAEGYDFSDEVGRKNLNQLVMTILTDEKNHLRIKRKLLKIASEVYSKSEDITTAVCCLISDIREPLIDVEEEILPQAPTRYDNHDFRVATLKVKLNTLEEAMEEAADSRDFLKAEQLKEEAQKIQEELAQLVESRSVPQIKVQQVKTVKDDPKTVSHCLDLLIALLELPTVRRISTALETVKNEFLLPLLDSSVADINWRVLQCLALFASMSIELAEEYLKVLCIPLMTCRAIPNYNKCALKVSIKAIADLYHLYGAQLFGGFNDLSNATQHSNTNHTRRLYDDGFEESIVDPNKFQFENIIDILMDLIDEEDVEIYEYASMALHRLILNNFPVSPAFIIRIILKWYNPATAKSTNQVQQALGVLIVMYASKVKGAKETIAKAVLPILRNVACVPKADPLSEIDTDNLLNYLAVITSSVDEKEATDLHLKLTRLILAEVGKCRNLVLLGYLTKLLTYLNIPVGDEEAVNSIIENAERLVEDESLPLDKSSIKCIEKFVQKVKDSVEQKNREKERENDDTNDNESAVANNGNTQTDSIVDSSVHTTENNSVAVVQVSREKHTEKDSNNRGEDSIHENISNNKNKNVNSSFNENSDGDDDIRTPSKKIRKNDEVETCQPNNVNEVSKTNSNTDTNMESPLRKGKRVRTPNKKYEEYIRLDGKIRKNGTNRHVEDKSVHSSNDRVGEVPNSNASDDTDKEANVSDNKSTDDSDSCSPLRKKTRLEEKNNRNLQGKNEENKRNSSISLGADVTRAKKITVEKESNNDDGASKQNVNNKVKTVEDTEIKRRKNGAELVENKSHKTVSNPKTNEGTDKEANASDHTASDDTNSRSPLRKKKRLIENNNSKLQGRNDRNMRSRANSLEAAVTRTKHRTVSRQINSADNKATKHNLNTKAKIIEDTVNKRVKNGASIAEKICHKIGSKSSDTATESKGSSDSEKDVSFVETSLNSSLRRSSRYSDGQLQEKVDRVIKKGNIVMNPRKDSGEATAAKKKDSNIRAKDSNLRPDKENKVSSNKEKDSSSSEADIRSPSRRIRQTGQKNGQMKEKHEKVKKNDDLLTSSRKLKDAASGEKTSDRRAKIGEKILSMKGPKTREVDIDTSNKQSFAYVDLPSPSRMDTRHSRNRCDTLPDKHNKDGKNRDVQANEKGSKVNEKTISTKGGAHDQNPGEQTSDERMKKRTRMLSKENRSNHSEKPDNENVSTDSEVLQLRSKRPKLAHLEKHMTRGTELDSAKKNPVLSEHNDTTYRKNSTFRPIAESTACMLQVTSGASPNGVSNRTLTRSLSRLSEQSESGLNSTDNDLLAIAKNVSVKLKNHALSSFGSETSYKSKSSRSTRSSARSSPIISRARRKNDIPNMMKLKNSSLSFTSETSYKSKSSRSTKSSTRSSPIISRAQRKYNLPNIIKKLRARKIQME